jgi:hypothetical protein
MVILSVVHAVAGVDRRPRQLWDSMEELVVGLFSDLVAPDDRRSQSEMISASATSSSPIQRIDSRSTASMPDTLRKTISTWSTSSGSTLSMRRRQM